MSIIDAYNQVVNEINEMDKLSKNDFLRNLRSIAEQTVVGYPDMPDVSAYGFIYKGYKWVTHLDPIWNDTLSFYLDIIPTVARSEIMELMQAGGFSIIRGHETVNEWFKSVSETYKFKGEKWSENWRFFVDMQMCYRYYSKVDYKEVLEDIYAWFNPKKIQFEDQRIWLRLFEEGVNEWFNKHWKVPRDVKWKDLETYTLSGDWVTAGATDMHVAKVKAQGGELVSLVKNKTSSYLTATRRELLNKVTNLSGQVNKITIKPDEAPNKTRVIVSSDTTTYILMSFISQWTTKGFQGTGSTVYMSEKETLEYWVSEVVSCSNRNIKVPIDQKGFDHHVDIDTLKVLFKVYENRLALLNDANLNIAVAKLKTQLFEKQGVWRIKIPEKSVTSEIRSYCYRKNIRVGASKKGLVTLEGDWNGGVASGWRWTIDWDTIIDFAQFYAIAKYTNVRVARNMFQGDDLAPHFYSLYDVYLVLAGYRFVGLEVNVKKFFISKTRSEFLRKVASSRGVVGYPARTVHSIMYNAPSSAAREERSPWSLVDTWLIMLRRGCIKSKIYNHCVKDVAGAFNMRKSEVADWVSTPAAVGGYGGQLIFGWTMNWRRMKTESERSTFRNYENMGMLMELGIKYNLNRMELNEMLNSKTTIVQKSGNKVRWWLEEVGVKERMFITPYKYEDPGRLEWKEDVPNIVKQQLILKILRNEILPDEVLRIDSATRVSMLKSNTSKSLLREWMLGGIKGTFPKNVRIGNDYMSAYYSEDLESVRRIVTMRKSHKGLLEKASLYIEMKICTSRKFEEGLELVIARPDWVLAQ